MRGSLRRVGNRLRDLAGTGNLGKWDRHHQHLGEELAYGDDTTYRLAADFLNDLPLVEDWGCGSGGFRKFCKTEYVGVDGSRSPFADKIADLEKYRSDAPGILMRHVLEHNFRWANVLDNALASFTSKMCLVIFTPFEERTKKIAYHDDVGVPDLSFARADLIERFGGISWTSEENLPTDTQYGVEHVFYLRK